MYIWGIKTSLNNEGFLFIEHSASTLFFACPVALVCVFRGVVSRRKGERETACVFRGAVRQSERETVCGRISRKETLFLAYPVALVFVFRGTASEDVFSGTVKKREKQTVRVRVLEKKEREREEVGAWKGRREGGMHAGVLFHTREYIHTYICINVCTVCTRIHICSHSTHNLRVQSAH